MKPKKTFVIVCLLLSTFLLYTARTVQASDIEKEEIENIF